MALQDKLIFTVYKNDKETFLDPFEFHLNSLDTNPGVIFEFCESDHKVTIQLVSSSSDVYVETLNESEWEPNKKGMHKLGKKEYVLSSLDNALFPQQYRIIIHYGSKVYYKSYKVTPLQAISNDKTYEDMKYVISNFSDSLLYDESRKRMVNSEKEEKNTLFLPDICNTLVRNYPVITSAIQRIKRNPIVNLEKELVKTNQYKAQNEKAIVKSIQSQYQKMYSTKTIERFNCLENSSLRFYIHESASLLTDVFEKVNRTKQYLVKSKMNIEKIRNGKQKKFDKHPEIKGLKKKIDSLSNTITILNERIDRYEESAQCINELFKKVNEFEYGSFLANIHLMRAQLNNKFFKTIPYNLVYTNLYLPLTGTSLGGNMFGTKSGYSFKSTSSLYEIYCLLVITKALESLGFTRSDLETDTGLLDLDVMDGEIELTFFSERYTCRIIYDRIIPNYDEIEDEDSGLVVVDSRNMHNRPDYQLLFYDDNEELVYCMVIDAKCRKFNNIDIDGQYNSNKEIKDTIIEYIQFRYHESDGYLLNGKSVNDLVIVYPEEQYRSDIIDSKLGIHYISLSPSKEYDKKSSFTNIKNLIKNNLIDL